MKVHDVKCWPMFFGDVWSGIKTAEIRENDRGYEPGDRLNQHEYDQHERKYLGRIVHQTITHVIRGPVFGLAEGWVVLSTIIMRRTLNGMMVNILCDGDMAKAAAIEGYVDPVELSEADLMRKLGEQTARTAENLDRIRDLKL